MCITKVKDGGILAFVTSSGTLDNVTANFYSHHDYNSKIASAETIAKALGGVTEEQPLTDNEDIKNRKSS